MVRNEAEDRGHGSALHEFQRAHLAHGGDRHDDAGHRRKRTGDGRSLVHRQNEHHGVDAHALGDVRNHFDERIEGGAVRTGDDRDERRDDDKEDRHAETARTHARGEAHDGVDHAEGFEARRKDARGDNERHDARAGLAHRHEEGLEAGAELVDVAAPTDRFADHGDRHAEEHEGRDVELDRFDAVLREDHDEDHRQEGKDRVDLRSGGRGTLHVVAFEDELFSQVFGRNPAFLAVEIALPEDVRDTHDENGRESGRDLVDEDVVKDREFAGLGGSGGGTTQKHH